LEGEGPPLLVCPTFIESFSVIHYLPKEDAFWQRVAEHQRLIRFDWHGTGLSQPDLADFSLDAACRDIDAVVSATGLHQFALWGTSSVGAIALKFAATRAEKVTRLMLYGAGLRSTDIMSEDALRAYIVLWRANPEVAAQTIADFSRREDDLESGYQLGRMYRESISGENAARILEETLNPDWNGEPYLTQIKAPTLVMHRRGDGLYPVSIGQKIAASIENARFLPLEGEVHYHAFGDSEAIIKAMLAFLNEDQTETQAPPHASMSSLRTVLFTDLVGHTEMMSRLGDERGRDVLREHERIIREVLKANGGTEVKTMGDGFMASFGSVTKAVECAIALQRAFADREGEPLNVRVGLNAGEPIEEDGDLFGATVIVASRIAAKAGGGEILVADTVRGLCSGKGFLFADRGEFVAKGFEEPVRVYEVRWREEGL
jgi:class 3 adenylate cyclase